MRGAHIKGAVVVGAIAVAGAAFAAPVGVGTQAPAAKPAPTTTTLQVGPTIAGFRRDPPGSGQVQSLAYDEQTPLRYFVAVRNLSTTQVSTTVRVKRMPGTPDETVIGTFPVDIPKGETREVAFSDARGLVDGCSPLRYGVSVENGPVRVARVTPRCSFTFSTTVGTSPPQGTMATNPACGQPWGVSASVVPPPKTTIPSNPVSPGGSYGTPWSLALRDTRDGRSVVAAESVPAGGGSTFQNTVTVTLTAPFQGRRGTFGLTYSDPTKSMTPPFSPPSTQNAWKVKVERSCTIDLGVLE